MLQGTIIISVEELRSIIREEIQRRPIIRPESDEPDPLLNVEKLRNFLEEKTGKKPATQTIYDLVFKRQIPFQKHSKFLFFRQSAIESWLNNGRTIL